MQSPMPKQDGCQSEDARSLLAKTGRPNNTADNNHKFHLLQELYRREQDGNSTRLREMQTLVNLSQHHAFRLLRALEYGGLAKIGASVEDAFAAEVNLTPKGRQAVESLLNDD